MSPFLLSFFPSFLPIHPSHPSIHPSIHPSAAPKIKILGLPTPDPRPPDPGLTRPPTRDNPKTARESLLIEPRQQEITRARERESIDGELRIYTFTRWWLTGRPLSCPPSRCRTPNARGKPNLIYHTPTPCSLLHLPDKKGPHKYCKGRQPPPKGQRASACSPAAARTSILTIAALLTGPVAWHWRLWQVDHPQSMSLRVFLAFSPSADGQITPISKCGSSTPSLGPRPRSRAIVR